ncbi:MAG: ammonium transporter [Gammaproteobacteria bacterium]|nr:ammonium transporter [Gammaproteobacteria bacterium]NIR83399.1 ammonium transporter [Gammaproteobacteria bacterium]NIR91321.1 ammonium transporter [Gammaproteobacteria bacterium]NIU04561.1 ammonium transporter [Gammaproteobacteria bacterium]NIV51603.1 ammonium transporter [Gammaproteobacteria bacterium]
MDNELTALGVIFTEFYYWLTVVIMFFIHVGFCMYEVGASRHKNHMHTLMKNTMLIPLVTITFFFFGWWIYFALPNGPGITGGVVEAPWAVPWSELMGPHMGAAGDPDGWARINGVFWAAFLLFSWTAASIVSGSVIERIQNAGFWICAVLIGSVFWIIDAAWGWHADGWMVQLLGYHDAYASGVIHGIAGGFALGILVVLGPRIGRFAPDGTPRALNPRNPWLVTIGLFLIYTGFWGFYVACNVPMWDVQAGDGTFFSATNIYLAPTTLSAITVNFLMSLAAGLLTGYIVSRGDPFWTYSSGLAGIIAASAGNDLYHPIQALIIAAVGVVFMYRMHHWVERRFKIDDAVGAVAVHGYAGFYGVFIAGFFLWGYPASPSYDAVVTPWGQFIGAVIMFGVLGFLPGWIAASILNGVGLLRIPREVELAGLDVGAVHQRLEDERGVIQAEQEEIAKGLGAAVGADKVK